MRVLFWGTPEFALPTLCALADDGHEIVGVVTRPDRSRGRGRRVSPSPVAALAERRGYRLLRPERPEGGDFLGAIRLLGADIGVVVAYGRILAPSVLETPRLGFINLHASLLPRLRGAAPVNWAIARGYGISGVTVIRMVEEMDAGPIVVRVASAIGPDETATELSGRLSQLGARVTADTLARLDRRRISRIHGTPQDHAAATIAPKVHRDHARVDWTRSAGEVGALMRGMDRIPGAWTTLGDTVVKVFCPHVLDRSDSPGSGGEYASLPGPGGRPGEIVCADPAQGLVVTTGRGAVGIGEVQTPGRRRMPSREWLKGARVSIGTRLQ